MISSILLTSFISNHFPDSTSFSDIYNINDTNSESCSIEYFYRNIKTNQCEKFCSLNEFINEICYINNLTENNILNITQNIRDLIKQLKANKNTNIIINGNNANYQIISSDKMEDNKDKNISIIDFGECEKKLKDIYEIDYILILQLDIFLSNSTNIVLKYELYNPYNLEKINLSLCNDMKMNAFLPYSISDDEVELYLDLYNLGYDLYNPNDSFYHDLCIPYTTHNKTDILLADRRLDYYKNKEYCEKDCIFKGYNSTYEKYQCECQIREQIDNNIDNIKFYGNLLISTFFELEKFSNIAVLKCYELVFSKYGQLNNYGSYILIFLSFVFLILMILYYIYGKKRIIKLIENIVYNKKNAPTKRKNIKKKISNMPNNIIINKKIFINNHNYINIKKSKKKKNKIKEKKNKSNSSINNNKTNLKLCDSYSYNKNKINPKYSSKKSIEFSKYNRKKTKKNNKNKLTNIYNYIYNDLELNSLPYEKALIYDKRTYIQYYHSLIMQKQIIFFTFISNIDYNIFVVKLSLLIFSFSLYFTVNTFFFDNDTIHRIYKAQGKLKFIYYILNIFYSTLISSVTIIILKSLALSNRSILFLKKINNKKKAIKESQNLIQKLNIKFRIYFFICIILLVFFWYFISAFCSVYKNSQILLIENTLSSYAISLLYPFAINLLPGIFRISALRDKKKNKNCLYSFGNFISLL